MYIEIVVHGAGLEKLKRLGKKGYKFSVCPTLIRDLLGLLNYP